MARGFIRGVLWGSCVSLSGVVLLSIFTDRPGPVVAPAQTDDAVVAAAPVDDTTIQPVENGNDTPVAPLRSAPEPDTLAGLRTDDLTPAAVPLAGDVSALGKPAPAGGEGSLTAPAVDAPVAGGGQTSSLSVPSAEPSVSVSTDPASPPAAKEQGDVAAEATPGPETGPAQPVAPVVQTEIAGLSAPSTGTTVPAPAPDETSISADPAQPPAPRVPVQQSAFAAAGPEVSPEPVQPAIPEAPVVSAGFAALSAAGTDEKAEFVTPAPASEPEVAQVAGADTSTAGVPSAQTLPVDVRAPAPGTGDAGVSDPAPETAPTIQTSVGQPDAGSSIPDEAAAIADTSSGPPSAENDAVPAPAVPGTLQGTLGNLAQGVRTNRLPNLGAAAEEEETAAEPAEPEAEAGEAAVITAPTGAKPVEKYARPADNPDGKPVMAIVLMDTGADLSAGTIGLPALRSFPYPVSFAVDATLPDAAERAAAYRAEGFEVLSLVNLPAGAVASDAAVTLSAALDAVPEAVGVLEGPGTGVQTTREASEQVTGSLADSGHGFVTQNRGLNTVQKLAARAGVPSAVVFRDFDGQDQSPAVIRRFLDQAAFRASQEGGVVMLGRLREETVSALLVWALQDRAGRVAIVPVSAALSVQESL
ncbi:divergent polysaccharide deacetylase family protein [uncultured Roseobacter sp.]|uniref:divergent polysaccharide deacetylase family protein n=1 Tax=uncultured Roseobacter sp. TaxID=114847 RepID=UPI0026394985|nr:divergent polysaccharide deacetylase family protein [uncultured Roseobacter sp.]